MATDAESLSPGEFADLVPALPSGARGRGARLNPGNRHDGSDPRQGNIRLHVLGEFLDHDREDGSLAQQQIPTQVFEDRSRSILTRVTSPDLGMTWTINPYRGCEHGCIYCYARPDHERLGWSCGVDFETKIIAKPDAPRLLRSALMNPRWKAETISVSGVTDCYQPIEKRMRVTRGCLEIMAQCRQPVTIVTKNRLVLRDLDLLCELAAFNAVRVAVSVTTLDTRLAAKMEPRASSPSERLKTIATLSEHGIPVIAMVAPVIPALTDREIPAILRAVSEAGASTAAYIMLRLPYQVKALFLDWLQLHFPERAAHVESSIRQMHDGRLYDSTFGKRHRGSGARAEQIGAMFHAFRRRYKLDRPLPPLSNAAFRPPSDDTQPGLFEQT